MLSPRRPRGSACAVFLAMWIALTGLMVPSPAGADTDLVIGGEAVVAYAQGDNVRIRAGASYDADIVVSVPEATSVTVLDGPFGDGAGNSWYYVAGGGAEGYMVSDFLARAGGGASSGGNASGSVTATDNVHLRSGPSVGYLSIGKIPAGTTVTVSDSMDGWLRVAWNGFEGWAYGEFFTDGVAPAPAPDPAPAPEPDPEPEPAPAPDPEPEIIWIEAGTRYTNDSVNFRSAPSMESTVYEVLPVATAVELTGRSASGFAEASVNGTTGWISLEFLGTTAPSEPDPVEWIDAGTRYTTDRVNFRTDATVDSGIIEVLGEGIAVELSGRSQSGFAEATVDGVTGWISLDYLSREAPAAPSQPSAPTTGSSSIIWPVSGGEWYIGQGYNGSSHRNSGSLWQYQYSFDLARTDESTGGQSVYSPVSGTVRWLDPSTGGISIDAGGGLAVALFHVDVDPSIQPGQSLSQGQYLGIASYPGGGGNGGWAHVHLTAWATSDGGNWDRRAVPFEGAYAISGQSFPASGAAQEWTGTVFYP